MKKYLFLDSLVSSIGITIISASTVLTYFLSSYLNNFSLGIFFGAIAFLSNMPQFFLAMRVSKINSIINFTLSIEFFKRITFFVLGIIIIAFSGFEIFIYIFLSIYLLYIVFEGLLESCWMNLEFEIVTEKFGKYFGYKNFLASLAQIIGAIITAKLILLFPKPYNYAGLFILGSLICTLSLYNLILLKKKIEITKKDNPNKLSKSKMLDIVKNDRNFMIFLGSMVFAIFGGFLGNFIVAVKIHSDLQLAVINVLMILSQVIFNVVFGYLVDYLGSKFVFGISRFIRIFCYMLLFFNNIYFVYASFILYGISLSCVAVSKSKLMYDLCKDKERRLDYFGVANFAYSFISSISPILIGAMLRKFSFNMVALVCIISLSAALIIFFKFVKVDMEIV